LLKIKSFFAKVRKFSKQIILAAKSFSWSEVCKVNRLEKPRAVSPPCEVFLVCGRLSVGCEIAVRLHKRKYAQPFQRTKSVEVLFASRVEAHQHVTGNLIGWDELHHHCQFVGEVNLRKIPRDMDIFF
jgi:hypothetical protein